MIELLFIRHGRTAWNDEGRIQGRHDEPLSERGRAEIAARRLPADFAGAEWWSSPLSRAYETAQLLGIENPKTDDRLREISWGDWEGMTKTEIAARFPAMIAEAERIGAAYRRPGGESPADVQARVMEWLGERSFHTPKYGVVCHRGLIGGLMALATGWDMIGKPPLKLDWTAAHRFTWDGARLDLVEPNIPLPLKSDHPQTEQAL